MPAEPLPESSWLQHAQADPATVFRREHANQRVRLHALIWPHRCRLPRLAAEVRRLDRERVGPGTHAKERDIDHRGLTGPLSSEQRGRDASGDRHPADRVPIGRCWHRHDSLQVRGRRTECASRPVPIGDPVEARPRPVLAAHAECGATHVDDLWIHLPDVLNVDVEAGPDIREKVGEEHVGVPHEPVEDVKPFGNIESQPDTPLVVVRVLHDRSERAARGHGSNGEETSLRISPLGMLHLDDLSAPFRQDSTRQARTCTGRPRRLVRPASVGQP